MLRAYSSLKRRVKGNTVRLLKHRTKSSWGKKAARKTTLRTKERGKRKKTNEEEDFDDDSIIFDVAILGAGMSGVSCAREICLRYMMMMMRKMHEK